MKQQPDKIFHDKLASFSKEVPPMAWDRIESGLENRKRGFFWISVAASITAIVFSAAVFYTYQNNSGSIASSNNHEHISAQDSSSATVDIPPSRVPEIEAVEKPEAIAEVEKKPASDVPVVERKKSLQRPSENVPLMADVDEARTTMESAALPDTAMLSHKEPTKLAFQAPAQSESITIVLTAEQTREYLLTKNTTTQATSGEKKSSTLKKLLKKAADLKVNQDPFGELRQKKNEILALNFRSEKQRGQKK